LLVSIIHFCVLHMDSTDEKRRKSTHCEYYAISRRKSWTKNERLTIILINEKIIKSTAKNKKKNQSQNTTNAALKIDVQQHTMVKPSEDSRGDEQREEICFSCSADNNNQTQKQKHSVERKCKQQRRCTKNEKMKKKQKTFTFSIYEKRKKT